MSEPIEEQEALVVGPDPAASMEAILGFLAGTPSDETPETGTAPGGASAPEPGQQPAAPEGTDAAGGAGAAPAAGDGGEPSVPDSGTTPTVGQPADTTPSAGTGALDAADLRETWSQVATGFEERQREVLRDAALEELREEYARYFEAIEQHPRLLVGQKVPSPTGNGEEVLRDAQDARDWQDAIKHVLVAEVNSRVEKRADEVRHVFETVHESIDLFRNNPDLTPGTKQFDRELADKFVAFVSDYAIKSNGKTIGFSVPVQPIINRLRAELAASRAAASAQATQPAAPAQPTPRQQQAAQQPRTPTGQFDSPQAGITSKAVQSAEGDDDARGVLAAFASQNGFQF